mmetsp:Transcript_53965/g.61438  ORF Transcript_53965/g.61438 Transcript_53965/m.61438 type:complete len:476 (-) Transcript_53965:440-1867(-)
MPSNYRGNDDNSHLWRIDIGGPPSKKRRTGDPDISPLATAIFEECSSNSSDSTGSDTIIVCGHHENSITDYDGDIDRDDVIIASEPMMVAEVDGYNINFDDDTVESILNNYIKNNDTVCTNEVEQVEVLREGVDKLWLMVSENNNNFIIKQQRRIEILESGGHWSLTDVLRRFVGNRTEQGYEYNDNNDILNKKIVAVVIQACKVLSELLLTDPNAAATKITTSTNTATSTAAKVKYQLYICGALDMIISAMKRYPSNFDVQLTGCKFLSHLISRPLSCDSCDEDNVMTNRTGVIDDLYRSTNGLDSIILLVGGNNFSDGGSPALPSMMMTSSERNNDFFHQQQPTLLSTNQIWQLFFSAVSVVQQVLRQSDPNSNRRSEMIAIVEERSINRHNNNFYYNDYDNDAMTEIIGGDDNDDMDGCEHIEDFHSSWGYGSNSKSKGFGKHMYEHIMSILIDEDDYNDADASREEEYMRL